jgi:hypothetical protein
MLAKNELKEKLSLLYEKEQDLSIKLRAEPDMRLKREIEVEKSAVNTKITHLRNQIETECDRVALKEIDKLLEQNNLYLCVEVNRTKIVPHKEVEIKYNCGHTARMLLRELIRSYSHHEGKNKPERNHYLLQRWERVLKHNEIFNVNFSCEECKKEKQSLKAKFGRLDVRPIGHARVTVRRLQ